MKVNVKSSQGFVVAVAALLTLAFALTSCAHKEEIVDAGGSTLAEVEQLSLEEQFAIYGERYLHVQQLLTDAQLQVSDDVWGWGGEAFSPTSGLTGPNQIPGATGENSYYLQTSRSIVLPGAVGAREDTEVMSEYLTAQGLEPKTSEIDGNRFLVSARTDDGFWFEYMVQPNGQYSVGVYSELFWGDYGGLLTETSDRIPESDILDESNPGVFTPFPSWEAPAIHGPEEY